MCPPHCFLGVLMEKKKAKLIRAFLPEGACPHGLSARRLLWDHGFDVEDVVLKTREDLDAIKAREQVKTTPVVWLEGDRVGGLSDLEKRFGVVSSSHPYAPLISLVFLSVLSATVLHPFWQHGFWMWGHTVVAFAMILFGFLNKPPLQSPSFRWGSRRRL